MKTTLSAKLTVKRLTVVNLSATGKKNQSRRMDPTTGTMTIFL